MGGWRGKGGEKQQISEFHGLFFPENTVFSVLLPKPWQAKKRGGEGVSHYMKNSSSQKENVLDTKSP